MAARCGSGCPRAPATASWRGSGRPVERPDGQLWPDIEASLHTALDPEVEALAETRAGLDVSLWPNFARPAAAAQAAWIAFRIRLLDTWPRVPSACAKWLTRSSSSIHGTSRSAAGSGRPAGQDASRSRVLGLELLHPAHAVEVGRRRVRQPLEAARRGAQVALDVGQAGGAGRA